MLYRKMSYLLLSENRMFFINRIENKIKRAKKMLPNVPEEVFEIWLSADIKHYGWQFKKLTDSFQNTPWERVFGREGTLEGLANLIWNREHLPLDITIFEPATQITLGMFLDKSRNEDGTLGDGYFKSSGSRLRFHFEHIEGTERFCAPIVVIRTFKGLSLFDGYHRMTSALLLNKTDFIMDAWIGESPSGDTTPIKQE